MTVEVLISLRAFQIAHCFNVGSSRSNKVAKYSIRLSFHPLRGVSTLFISPKALREGKTPVAYC